MKDRMGHKSTGPANDGFSGYFYGESFAQQFNTRMAYRNEVLSWAQAGYAHAHQECAQMYGEGFSGSLDVFSATSMRTYHFGDGSLTGYTTYSYSDQSGYINHYKLGGTNNTSLGDAIRNWADGIRNYVIGNTQGIRDKTQQWSDALTEHGKLVTKLSRTAHEHLAPAKEIMELGFAGSGIASGIRLGAVHGSKLLGKTVQQATTRMGRDGKAVTILFEDGSKIDITIARVVERAVLGTGEYFEVYGDGADFNGSSSRITDIEALPTHKIIMKNQVEKEVRDVLNDELIYLDSNLIFDRLVGFNEGFYINQPEFNYVLLNDENIGIERVVCLDDVDFETIKV
ncbi:hypothetical protein LVD17_27165 [Fulvivirga ulvae]|uniref:hypothetical protein n=1 Tax=Fulvivirga ulvae TaxID=2904245 RepID=UPI001F1D2E60|nr:hypothetical protein [Fulvivirga ulvae]UII31972.1 hypothetical protein LVD17_27165 [Fulvivirga ulvae]